MEDIRHKITCCNYQTGNNIGSMEFAFKVKYKNDEGNKLVGIVACEENFSKFTTRYCKRQVTSAMEMSSKSKLMSTNAKSSFLIKVLTDQHNANHTMSSKDITRFSDDFSIIQALENDDVLADSLLDFKSFCGNHSMFDKFFDALKDVIME